MNAEILTFFSKLSAGTGEQMLTRQMRRLGNELAHALDSDRDFFSLGKGSQGNPIRPIRLLGTTRGYWALLGLIGLPWLPLPRL